MLARRTAADTPQQPLDGSVVGERGHAFDADARRRLALRRGARLLRHQQIHGVVDACGQRAAPAVARRARVQGPLQIGIGLRVTPADEDLIAAVAIGRTQHGVRRQEIAVGIHHGEWHHADRQATLGRDALKFAAG